MTLVRKYGIGILVSIHLLTHAGCSADPNESDKGSYDQRVDSRILGVWELYAEQRDTLFVTLNHYGPVQFYKFSQDQDVDRYYYDKQLNKTQIESSSFITKGDSLKLSWLSEGDTNSVGFHFSISQDEDTLWVWQELYNAELDATFPNGIILVRKKYEADGLSERISKTYDIRRQEIESEAD